MTRDERIQHERTARVASARLGTLLYAAFVVFVISAMVAASYLLWSYVVALSLGVCL